MPHKPDESHLSALAADFFLSLPSLLGFELFFFFFVSRAANTLLVDKLMAALQAIQWIHFSAHGTVALIRTTKGGSMGHCTLRRQSS